MPTRKAHAEWNGAIDSGQGRMEFGSGAFEGPYSFESRMQDGAGTNPEELIGAAHAGCFTMALSLILGEAQLVAERMDTKAEVTLEKIDDGFTITSVHLTLRAKIRNVDREQFLELANKAKSGCPVSQLMKAPITLDAALRAYRTGFMSTRPNYPRIRTAPYSTAQRETPPKRGLEPAERFVCAEPVPVRKRTLRIVDPKEIPDWRGEWPTLITTGLIF